MFKPISLKNQTLISMFTYTDKKYRSVIPFYLQFFFHNKVCICRQVYKFRFLVFFLMYKIVLYKFWLNYRTCRCALIQLHVKTVGQNYFFPFMIRFYYLSKCTPLKKRPSCMRRSRGGRDVRTFWIIHTLNLPNPFHPANKIIPA